MRVPCMLATLLAITAPARADEAAATATVLFDRAEQLVKAGKLAEACPQYAASFKADPQLGVLLHLADCHEKIGKTASAWSEFRDAVERARKTGDAREAYAQGRVDALAPKLARVRVDAPTPVPPGLVVKLDETEITALLGGESPVDPGDHVVSAAAPGVLPWRTTVKIAGDAATVTVQVGPLEMPAATEIAKQTPLPLPRAPIRRGWSRVGIAAALSITLAHFNPVKGCVCGQTGGGGFDAQLYARYELGDYVAFRPTLTGLYQTFGFDSMMMDNAATVTRAGVAVAAPFVLVFDRRRVSVQLYAGPELGVMPYTNASGQLAITSGNALAVSATAGLLVDIGPVSLFSQIRYTFTDVAAQAPTPTFSNALGVGYGFKL